MSDRAIERQGIPGVEHGSAWLRAFLHRGSGLVFDESQAAQVAALAERKLVDLFDVAEATALANGRTQILHHDLPLTKGLQHEIGQAAWLAGELELRPLLTFLADAGVRGPLDELVRAEVPRLMAALLLLAARIIAILEPMDMSTEERLERLLRHEPTEPTRWELERAGRILDLTLWSGRRASPLRRWPAPRVARSPTSAARRRCGPPHDRP